MDDGRKHSVARNLAVGVAAVFGVVVLMVAAGMAVLALAVRSLDDQLATGCEDSEVDLVVDATDGDVDAVLRSLDRGADPDRRDDAGNSALACAGPAGHASVVRALLDAGANPNTVARDDDTVVGDAVAFCQDDVLAALLAAGADPDAGEADTTPLAEAVRRGTPEAAELLLEGGADPDRFRAPVLDLGANESTSPCTTATLEQQDAAMAAVLAHEGDPALVLGTAAAHGWPTSVALALAAGADPDDSRAGEPLLAATIGGRAKVVDLLLAAGADPDRGTIGGDADPTGSEPVDQARWFCNVTGDWNGKVRTCDPVISLWEATTQPDEGAEAPLDSPYPSSPLLQAVWDGNTAIVEPLLAAGADPNQVSALEATPLHAVAVTGDVEMAFRLIAAGATAPDTTVLPSTIAANAGNDEVAEILRGLGA